MFWGFGVLGFGVGFWVLSFGVLGFNNLAGLSLWASVHIRQTNTSRISPFA